MELLHVLSSLIHMHTLHDRITLHTHYSPNMSEMLQDDLTQKCITKIENLSDSYFQKFLKKSDAEITINVDIQKTTAEKFLGKFHFVMDGEVYDYHNDTPFEKPYDLVSHAFQHLKEHLADA